MYFLLSSYTLALDISLLRGIEGLQKDLVWQPMAHIYHESYSIFL